MPLFVEVAGADEREVFGPFPEKDLLDTLAFARIGSARGDMPRDVVWSCRGRDPIRIRRYLDGEKQEKQSSEGFQRLERCITRSGSACFELSPKPPRPRDVLPLPERLDCPADDRSVDIAAHRLGRRVRTSEFAVAGSILVAGVALARALNGRAST